MCENGARYAVVKHSFQKEKARLENKKVKHNWNRNPNEFLIMISLFVSVGLICFGIYYYQEHGCTIPSYFEKNYDIEINVPLDFAWESWPKDVNLVRIFGHDKNNKPIKGGVKQQYTSEEWPKVGSSIIFTTEDGNVIKEDVVIRDKSTKIFQTIRNYTNFTLVSTMEFVDHTHQSCKIAWVVKMTPKCGICTKFCLRTQFDNLCRFDFAANIKLSLEGKYQALRYSTLDDDMVSNQNSIRKSSVNSYSKSVIPEHLASTSQKFMVIRDDHKSHQAQEEDDDESIEIIQL